LDLSEDSLQRKALYKYFVDNKINAVLAEYGPTGAAVMDVCRDAGVALIVHFHGFDAYKHKVLQIYNEKYKKMFQVADAIIVVSNHMEEQIVGLSAPRGKVHYNPYGIDSEMFYGADPAKASPVFLATGRFVDKKSPHLTLMAFHKVYQRIPEARLIMVGDGNLLDACSSLANVLGIEHAVNFMGVQSHEKIAQLMRQVRAFVQHSRIPFSGDSEGTPVAVLEASLSGLPVISTKHAGIPDVILDGQTGFLVDECDVDAMADRMIQIANDPSLADQMGKKGRERILGQFTMDHSISNLANIISMAVKQRHSNTEKSMEQVNKPIHNENHFTSSESKDRGVRPCV